jgi:hypothetical protein
LAGKKPEQLSTKYKNIMEKRTISETIIDLESAALEAWHDGNPSPYLELYSKDFTYFDPAHEKRIDRNDGCPDL